MKIECNPYSGRCVLSDFVDIENESNILNNNDIIGENCVLQCSSHSTGQFMGLKVECTSNGNAISKSLPSGFSESRDENINLNICDGYENNSCQCSTPYLLSDSWSKTWPEKCDRNRSRRMKKSPTICGTCESENTRFNKNKNDTLNEAIEDISLYDETVSSHTDGSNNISNKGFNQIKKHSLENETSEHKQPKNNLRSDTVLINSQLPSMDQFNSNTKSSHLEVNSGCKSKRKLTNFLNRNVLLGWKPSDVPSSIGNFLKFFGNNNNAISSLPHPNVASSSALFQYSRPPNVPAKSLEEEEKHREEYKAILAAAKRKEAMNLAMKKELEKKQLLQEEGMANAAKFFANKVLPNWEIMKDNKKTRELWWQGLPSNVRGKVWSLAIGNELNLTQQLYDICLERAQERIDNPKSKNCESINKQELSLDAIKLDISRTFPHLCIFQEGGPYSHILHSLLAAYVCYRPDVGYVQGMSYIAAILILNMEQNSAFICFANLLNQPLHLSAFTLNQSQMLAYFEAFHEVFNYNLPKLCSHFQKSGLTPDLYLLDWIYTIFAKAMPLDVACRIWDVFLRDGYEFIFRTALGILSLHQDILMKMDFLDGAQFLTRLPDNISSENLFKSIQSISVNIGKTTFSQIVERQISISKNLNES